MARKKNMRRSDTAEKKATLVKSRTKRNTKSKDKPWTDEPIQIEDGIPLTILLKDEGIRDDDVTNITYCPPDTIKITAPTDDRQGAILPDRKWIWTTDVFQVKWTKQASQADRQQRKASGKLTITIRRPKKKPSKNGKNASTTDDGEYEYEYNATFIPSK